jgi:hypothetical protein
MVLAEHLADDRGRLPRPRSGGQPEVLVHRVEDAPLDGLETVADIRQGTRSDDAQRVAEIALLGGFPEICFERRCCGFGHGPLPHPALPAHLSSPRGEGERPRATGHVCKVCSE